MTLEDRLTLLKAGYTKNEIEQMDSPLPGNPDAVPVQQPVPEPSANPEPDQPAAQVAEPVAVPAAVPAPVPAPAPAEPSMADLMQSIAKLTSAVQANAIAQSVMPNPINSPTAEDMLAEIIRPTFKERQ